MWPLPGRLSELVFLWLACQIIKKAVEYRQYKAEQQCPPESSHLKSFDEVVDKKDNGGIDHQEKQSEGKDGNGNGEHNKDGFDDDIDYRQNAFFLSDVICQSTGTV